MTLSRIMMNGRVTAVAAMFAAAMMCSAAGPFQTRWHDEAKDTTEITEILVTAQESGRRSAGALAIDIAKTFLGRPYVAKTLEGDPEMLTVNVDEFDCTTFVETVAAMAMTVRDGRTSWRDFLYNLRSLRYRGGNVGGYASRLHYISDWVIDNAHRGNVMEVTNRVGRNDYAVKTLDFMTRNRDKYPALQNDTVYEDMKRVEIGYMSHRYPYVKTMNVGTVKWTEGDIVAFTTSLKNLDVTHMGLVTLKNGVPYLIHASSKTGRVTAEEMPLADYLRRNKNITGVRIIRITD